MREKENKKEIHKIKKAEVSIGFIVTVTLLVLGFVILMIFFYNIGGTKTLDTTICHESVIYRATLPELIKSYLPLKCRTNKICITSGRILDIGETKECEDFRGETGITTIRVKNIGEIEKVYAQQILSCWSMMGEGKVSLFNQYVPKTFGVGEIYPTCVICDRIAFDKNLIVEPNFDLASMDVSKYMMTHKVPGKDISYFEAIASENGKVSVKEQLFEEINNVEVSSKEKSDDTETSIPVLTAKDASKTEITSESVTKDLSEQSADKTLQTKESAIMFMQISSPTQGGSILNIGKLAAGVTFSSFVLAPTITGKALKYTGSVCISNALVCSILAITGVVFQQTNVAYSRYVAAGYCGDISIGTDARSGCSAIRTVNYNAGDISKYCQVIESIP